MSNNITGTIYPEQIPPITSSELLSDTTFMLVTSSGQMVRILRSELYANLVSLGLKGDQGPIGPIGPRGLTGPEGEQGVAGPVGPAGPEGKQGPVGATGSSGTSGWTPVLALVARVSDVVVQVVDWTGGTGTKPATGQYVSSAGLTADINLATKVNGEKGVKGDAGASGTNGTLGWSPLMRIETVSNVKYLYVYDWTGGSGAKPTTVGYVTTSGISPTPTSGGFDYDVSGQILTLNSRVDNINERLLVIENIPSLKEYVNSFLVRVLNTNTMTPPATPVEFDLYIVPVNATGVWAERAGNIAYFKSGSWNYVKPLEGYLAYNLSTKSWINFDGTSWVDSQASLKTSINNKVDKDGSKVLSENDFTSADKTKLDNLSKIKSVKLLNTNAVEIETMDGTKYESNSPVKFTGYAEYKDTVHDSSNTFLAPAGEVKVIPNNSGVKTESLPTGATSFFNGTGFDVATESMYLIEVSAMTPASSTPANVELTLNDGTKDVFVSHVNIVGGEVQSLSLLSSVLVSATSVLTPKIKSSVDCNIYDIAFKITKLV